MYEGCHVQGCHCTGVPCMRGVMYGEACMRGMYEGVMYEDVMYGCVIDGVVVDGGALVVTNDQNKPSKNPAHDDHTLLKHVLTSASQRFPTLARPPVGQVQTARQ